VSKELAFRGVPTVVIERDREVALQAEEKGLPYVLGDATDDATLLEAGVTEAKSLASVLSQDTDNLFVTLSARALKSDLTIITWTHDPKNETKMVFAGAQRVLNTYKTGGRLIVRQLLDPSVTEFIDAISGDMEDLCLEEVELRQGSTLNGRTLRDAPLHGDLNVMILGVKQRERGMVFNPPPDLVPEAGDILVLLGKRNNLKRVEELASGGV
jgi:voltage-gated potassium channel